jgi:hypothetical protein
MNEVEQPAMGKDVKPGEVEAKGGGGEGDDIFDYLIFNC